MRWRRGSWLRCCAVELEIRALTPDDDADGMGRLLVEGYQSLPDSPVDPEYYAELADVGTRIERSIVFGAFARRRHPRLRHVRGR